MKKIILSIFLFTFSSIAYSQITSLNPLIGTKGFEVLKQSFIEFNLEDYGKPEEKFMKIKHYNLESLRKQNRIFMAYTFRTFSVGTPEENYYLFENYDDVQAILKWMRKMRGTQAKWYYIDKDLEGIKNESKI